jgi:hypothetical protein
VRCARPAEQNRKIEASRDSSIENIQVFGQDDTRLDHMKIVHLVAGASRERACQAIRLLLIVALDADAIIRRQDRLEQRRHVCSGHHLAL